MRNQCRLYERPDGGISTVTPMWDDPVGGFGRTAHKTEAEWYEHAVTKGIDPTWINRGDVACDALPDNDFFNQWRFDGQAVSLDHTLVTRERWRRIRAERDRLLKASDWIMVRSLETGDRVQEWKNYRQALRDLPLQHDPLTVLWPTPPDK